MIAAPMLSALEDSSLTEKKQRRARLTATVSEQELSMRNLTVAVFCLCATLIGSGCSPPANALIRAASLGDTNRVAKLLSKGVPINSVETGMLRQTALAAACRYEEKAMVKLLLKNGADPNLRSGLFGTTPVIEAIGSGDPNLPIIRMLLEAGADPNVADLQGNRPLDYANARPAPQTIELLKSKGGVSRKPAEDNAKSLISGTNADFKAVPFKVRTGTPR